MKFFKKNGRPTEEELMMIQSIERIITLKRIPIEDVPECNSLDDLIEVKTLLENYPPFAGQVEDFPINEDKHIDEPSTVFPTMENNEPIEQDEIDNDQEINDWVQTEQTQIESIIEEKNAILQSQKSIKECDQNSLVATP